MRIIYILYHLLWRVATVIKYAYGYYYKEVGKNGSEKRKQTKNNTNTVGDLFFAAASYSDFADDLFGAYPKRADWNLCFDADVGYICDYNGDRLS